MKYRTVVARTSLAIQVILAVLISGFFACGRQSESVPVSADGLGPATASSQSALRLRAEGGQPGWGVHIDVQCGDEMFTGNASFVSRGALGEIADVYLGEMPATTCTATLEVRDHDEQPVDICEAESVEFTLVTGEVTLVTARLLCRPGVPGGLNISVELLMLNELEVSEFPEGKYATLCHRRSVHINVVEHNSLPYEVELDYVDPADVAQVLLFDRETSDEMSGGVFDFLCLNQGSGPHGAVPLVARLRQPLVDDVPTEITFSIHCYAPLDWEAQTCDLVCEPEDERAIPSPTSVEAFASDDTSPPECAVLDGGILSMVQGEPLSAEAWTICQAILNAPVDLSLLAAQDAQLGVELCLEGDGEPIPLSFYVGQAYPERMYARFDAHPGCNLYTLSDWQHDGDSTGDFAMALAETVGLAFEWSELPSRTLEIRKVLVRCLCEDNAPLNRCGACGPTPPELCDPNGQDEDCDGLVNEDWSEVLGQPCRVGEGACEREGAMICDEANHLATICSATPGEPQPEQCNNIDDDCNGEIDNGLREPMTCGEGACQAQGERVCRNGEWIPGCHPIPPTPEICDGVDNDCDGEIDEGLREPTTCGEGACQARGERVCHNGAWVPVCMPGQPAPEICDGIDNDCDGQVDEGLPVEAITCGLGQCRAHGERSCRNGQWVSICNPGPPGREVCDGVDNDCNGEVDEGLNEMPRGEIVSSRGVGCEDGEIWRQRVCVRAREQVIVSLRTEVNGRGYSWDCGEGRSSCRRTFGENCWDAPANCQCQNNERLAFVIGNDRVVGRSQDWNGEHDPRPGTCHGATDTTTFSFNLQPGSHVLRLVHNAWQEDRGCANPQSLHLESARIH